MALRALLVPLVMTGLFTGCGQDDPAGPVDLKITIQGWTGWQREQPEPTTMAVTVQENDTFTVQVSGG